MICMVCMIAPKDGFLQTMHSRKIMQIMHPGRGVREKHAEIAGEG